MRPLLRALALVAVMSTAALAQSVSERQQIENVAAFARLYGAARYFYPSDAAAALDWDRLAILGVDRVRLARDRSALQSALREIFTPLGPGIEVAPTLATRKQDTLPDASLVGWRYRGAGMSAIQGPYTATRTNRVTASSTSPSAQAAILSRLVTPDDSLRGRAIRLRGQLRVTQSGSAGWVGFWLRVDRPDRQMGFFDNMSSHPARDSVWREYSIEGTIASDATAIAFGALAIGGNAGDVDAIELAVRSTSGEWIPLPLADAGFEDARAKEWMMMVDRHPIEFQRMTDGAVEGHRFLHLGPRPVVQTPTDLFEAPIAGAFADVDLGSGLKARVALALTDAEAKEQSAALQKLLGDVKSAPNPSGHDDETVRLADVVVAWNVFRHFYPYFDETRVDWDARLRPQLETAFRAQSELTSHLASLRTLVADAQDGHGSVSEPSMSRGRAMLPVQFRVIEKKLVVTASGTPDVHVGDVVAAIDGAKAMDREAAEAKLSSGSPQWRDARAASALGGCAFGKDVKLTLESAPAREIALPCTATRPTPEARPDSIVEIEPGTWYVDLTRVKTAELLAKRDELARAKGVVFDVRGYPTEAGAAILPYLIDSVDTENWMHVAEIVGPFGQNDGWVGFTWHLRPAKPHIGGTRVFLTDGRAISYAESVMGYVGDMKLGTIIGATTAATNGNVAMFAVPSGFRIGFTGMRVTRHDGKTPYHMVGTTPDIPLAPTIAGLRAGKDELLQRAISVVRDSKPVL